LLEAAGRDRSNAVIGDDMPSFSFRLRFHLPAGRRLNVPGCTVLLTAGIDTPLLLASANAPNELIEDASRLIVWGGPYASEEEAANASERTKYALICWSIATRTGVDLGKNTSMGMYFDVFRKAFQQSTGTRLLNDLHGVTVYDSTDPVTFDSPSATFRLGRPLFALADAFARHFGSSDTLTPKQQVAYELFASSQFESGERSRFLLLVMSVEALLDPALRDEETQSHVLMLIDATTKSTIPKDQKQSILKTLSYMDKESIGQASRRLVKTIVGDAVYWNMKARDFFTLCYSMRSELVHRGQLKEGQPDIRAVVGDLEMLVADVLKGSILLGVS
jgi:hypothetical protein